VRVAEPFVHRLRVRYAECDPQGVLFNANYLAYIDHTITEMWREAFGGYEAMLGRGVDIVVAETRLRFRGAARFDEEIVLSAVVTRIGETAVTSWHRFERLNGAPVLDGEIRHVFVARGTNDKITIPDWAREGLGRWYEPQPHEAAAD
jgi:acyl-CoA thioester hydrolase